MTREEELAEILAQRHAAVLRRNASYAEAGRRMARAFFKAKRGPRVETHLTEPGLAALLSIAYQLGAEGKKPK